MDRRERAVVGTSATLLVAAVAAMALLLPEQRSGNDWLVLAFVIGYAAVSRVRFEFGGYYVVPEQLVFVPTLLLAPLHLVPLVVAAAGVFSVLPDVARRTWHSGRSLNALADSWSFLTPVLVLAWLAPGEPSLAHADVYLVALVAQVGTDLGWTLLRNRLLDHLPARQVVNDFAGTARVDIILSPVAFSVALAAADAPLLLVATIPPLVWLLEVFSRDRQERYAASLELNRAYRGTVMLLADVVEAEDSYTADHSRSVVDLVNLVADDRGLEGADRQELEFAAMLHDVGKIAVPKDILNKPSALTDEEFATMKTHPVEGQFMLDRVGGLLGRVGEIVRSCHERWDGRGYPDGLVGEDVPLAARIVFVCDAYNAMTTDRVYRPAMSHDEAVQELIENAGTQFDPDIVVTVVSITGDGQNLPSPVGEIRALLASTPTRRNVGAAAS
jgi:HD-GYP domain-containing protein (c-di-GMP phosphodiesterase class II)